MAAPSPGVDSFPCMLVKNGRRCPCTDFIDDEGNSPREPPPPDTLCGGCEDAYSLHLKPPKGSCKQCPCTSFDLAESASGVPLARAPCTCEHPYFAHHKLPVAYSSAAQAMARSATAAVDARSLQGAAPGSSRGPVPVATAAATGSIRITSFMDDFATPQGSPNVRRTASYTSKKRSPAGATSSNSKLRFPAAGVKKIAKPTQPPPPRVTSQPFTLVFLPFAVHITDEYLANSPSDVSISFAEADLPTLLTRLSSCSLVFDVDIPRRKPATASAFHDLDDIVRDLFHHNNLEFAKTTDLEPGFREIDNEDHWPHLSDWRVLRPRPAGSHFVLAETSAVKHMDSHTVQKLKAQRWKRPHPASDPSPERPIIFIAPMKTFLYGLVAGLLRPNERVNGLPMDSRHACFAWRVLYKLRGETAPMDICDVVCGNKTPSVQPAPASGPSTSDRSRRPGVSSSRTTSSLESSRSDRPTANVVSSAAAAAATYQQSSSRPALAVQVARATHHRSVSPVAPSIRESHTSTVDTLPFAAQAQSPTASHAFAGTAPGPDSHRPSALSALLASRRPIVPPATHEVIDLTAGDSPTRGSAVQPMDISPAPSPSRSRERAVSASQSPAANTTDDIRGPYVDYARVVAAAESWHRALKVCLPQVYSLTYSFDFKPPKQPPTPWTVGSALVEVFKEFQKPPALARPRFEVGPGICVRGLRFNALLRAADPSYWVYRSTGPGVHRSCQTLAMEHITSEMDLFQSRGTYFVPALSPVGLDDRRKSLFVTCGRISVWAIIRSGRLMRLSPFWVMYLLFMVEATRTRGGRPVHTAEEAEEVMRQANAALVDLPLLSAVDTRLANELKPWPSSHLEPIPSAEEAPALHEYLIDLNVTVPSLQERNAEYHRGVTLALFSHVLLGRNLATFPPPPEWKEFLTGFSTPLAYNTRVDDELTLPDILARPGELANESGSVDMTKPMDIPGLKVLLAAIARTRPTASLVCGLIQTSTLPQYQAGPQALRDHTRELLSRYLCRSGHPKELPAGMVPELQLKRDQDEPEDVRPALFVRAAFGDANITLGSSESKITLRFIDESTLETNRGARYIEWRFHLCALAIDIPTGVGLQTLVDESLPLLAQDVDTPFDLAVHMQLVGKMSDFSIL